MENKRRKFNGKLMNFDNRHEANVEKKHLKSYLQGRKFFRYGTHIEKDASGIETKMPTYYQVLESWE